MGCWNETCGITNLPIRVGDEIVVFILRQLGRASCGETYCYNDNYAPICLPFIAEYDDYGGFEKIDNEELTLKEINRFDFFKIIHPEDESYELCLNELIYEKIEINNVQSFVESLEDLYVDFQGKIYPITIWMCHKGVYNALLDSAMKRMVYNETYDLYERNKRIVEEYFYNAKRAIELSRLSKQNISDDKETESIDSLEKLSIKVITNHLDLTEQYFYDMIVDNHTNYIQPITEYLCFCWILNLLRKGFYSQTGLGSQSYELYLHSILAKWTLEFIEQQKKKAYRKTNEVQEDHFGCETII